MPKKILVIAGARPNFMKVASVLKAARERSDVETFLVHTGQHYDRAMSDVFFQELGIGEPDLNLGVGSGSHAEVTAKVMIELEPVLMERQPDALVVVGDVNSTLAGALTASKLGITIAHVEAGLRSYDRSMPEELNRVVTDSLSDLLLVSEESGIENLKREGVAEEKIHFVGNTMIDTLLSLRERAESSDILTRHGLEEKSYAVLTLHRPSNVDAVDTLRATLERIVDASRRLPIAFPVHPRTRAVLESSGLLLLLENADGMALLPAATYLDFMKLTSSARVVLTDSGGIQEETTVLQVPCLTLRDNTERPSTVDMGTNTLVGAFGNRLLEELDKILAGKAKTGSVPPLWDGSAGTRIVDILASV